MSESNNFISNMFRKRKIQKCTTMKKKHFNQLKGSAQKKKNSQKLEFLVFQVQNLWHLNI